MINAMGRKKRAAASTHKLIEDVPLCAAAAIQRGPSTVAILKKDVPETHLFRKLLDGIRGAVRRLAHRVWSSAGMRSSCLRKLTINGSSELSNPPQGPKYVTRPSCRKT